MTTNTGFRRCDRCGTPNPRAVYLTQCLGCGATLHDRPEPVAPEPTKPRKPSRRLLWATAAYGLVLFAAVAVARLGGDLWWPRVFLLLSPRWLFFVPMIPLIAWAVVRRSRRVGAILAMEALIVAGPLMGFNVPWSRLASSPTGPTLRVLTLNRGTSRLDTPRLAQYLDRHRIDVVCFQEPGDHRVLDAYLDENGWHRDPDRMIATRSAIVENLPRSTQRNMDGARYTMTMFRVRIAGPDGRPLVVGSLHMPTLRPGIAGLLKGDVDGFRSLVAWSASELGRVAEVCRETPDAHLIVAGDFNIPDDTGVLSAFATDANLSSAFEEAGIGWGYSRPSSMPWVRIDHILASPDLAARRCWVGPSFGSDHRSVVAEYVFPPSRP